MFAYDGAKTLVIIITKVTLADPSVLETTSVSISICL